MTDDVVAFLRAAHEEIERVASAAAEVNASEWTAEDAITVLPDRVSALERDGRTSHIAEVTHDRATAHIALHDPRSALARVHAEREIVEWCAEVAAGQDLSTYGEFGSLRHEPLALAITGAVETLRALAWGHRYTAPGWREEWTPEGVEVTA